MTTEQIDLGNGHTAEIRTTLTGGDQQEWYIQRGKLLRANGTARPARSEPDPDDPQLMKDYPAEPAVQTEEDTFALLDWLIDRLVTSCSMPGVLPWRPRRIRKDGTVEDPGTRAALDLDVVNAIDNAVTAQQLRIQGIAPKPRTGSTSALTSAATAAAPPGGTDAATIQHCVRIVRGWYCPRGPGDVTPEVSDWLEPVAECIQYLQDEAAERAMRGRR